METSLLTEQRVVAIAVQRLKRRIEEVAVLVTPGLVDEFSGVEVAIAGVALQVTREVVGAKQVRLRPDVASGGGSGGTLKSFNPLFPKFASITEASTNAPINFIDVFPSVTVQPWRNFAIRVGVDVLWRYSVRDAFYQPPGVPLVPGSANKKRFLGAQSNLQAEWQATSHISVNAAYVHFLTEGFLKAAGANDIDFLGVWASDKF